MNNKAQALSIIIFVGIALTIVLTALFTLYIVNTPLEKLSDSLNATSPEASNRIDFVNTRFTQWWDNVVMLILLLNVLLLFISAFLVDVHPAFLVIYIGAIFFLFLFAPTVVNSIQEIWNKPTFVSTVNNMPMLEFILNNFMVVLLGIVILSGIFMYSKIKLFGSSEGV